MARSTGDPVAKFHRVEITLARRIQDGAYELGRLPSERALAEEFQVARVTVRHALKRLAERGLVARQQRSGTSALAGDSAQRPRLLREHIDQFLDRGRPDQRRVLRFALTQATSKVAAALGLNNGDPVLRIVRLRSRSGFPMTYTESFIPQKFAHAVNRAGLSRRALMQALEDGGVKVGAAEQTVRAERCPEEIAGLLGITSHDPVLRLERVVFTNDGEPVQLLIGRYHAERFDIQMTLSREDDVTRVWIRQR